MHFGFKPLRKRVHDRNAHAVQTARNFVRVFFEFTARVQNRHDHFQRGDLLFGVNVHGNPASVVLHFDHVFRQDPHDDVLGVAGHVFVDGVVHDFVDHLVKAGSVLGANVHPWTFAHSFEALEDLDHMRIVIFRLGCLGHR